MKMLEYSSVVFACCVIFSILYWRIFNLVILKQIRYQLFALRDETRRIAIEKGLSRAESFRQLERFICKTIAFSPCISLTSFVLFVTKFNKLISNKDNSLDEETPAEFIQIKDAAAKFSLVIMAFNSPWMLFIVSFLTPVLLAFGKLTRTGLYRRAEQFVEKTTPEPDGCLQPA
jgi:hypothetical protein